MEPHVPPDATIFVVDDDDAVRDSLQTLLEVHGIAVEAYASVSAFVGNYRRPSRGVLILDQHLPALSGVDFLASPTGQSLGIPVILVTGHSDRNVEQRARDAGVAELLHKPVSARVLIATVARLAGGQ